MQRVETALKTLIRQVDDDTLQPAEKKAMTSIRRLATDARLDIRDYELSETREEQLKCAVKAKKRLAKLQAAILVAGMAFGPADVAQISAQCEQINGWLV